MATEYLVGTALVGSALAQLYLIPEGELAAAALIPMAGFWIDQLGHLSQSETISRIGYALILGSGLALPGATVEYGARRAFGDGFITKALSYVAGGGVTIQMGVWGLQWAGRAGAAAILGISKRTA